VSGAVEPRGRRVLVTGAGVVSPLGGGRRELAAALVAGRSALAPASRPLAGAVPLAAELRDFAAETDLGTDVNLRPLDRAGRLLTVAATRAFADCGVTPRNGRLTGLVAGTLFGSVTTISEFDRRQLVDGPRYVKPLDFANTVINAAAGQAAIWLGCKGVNATFAGGPTAALEAIAFAAEQVRDGRGDLVLAGGVEELADEALLTFGRAGLLAGSAGDLPLPLPFAAGRNGVALAEGAALLVLEGEEAARSRGATVLAEVKGFGSAWGEGDEAVSRAVAAAIHDAGITAGDVGVWVASASGSPEVDRREAVGVARALGGRAVPVAAPKALFGEALGASGAFQAVVLVEALATGTLPGTPGADRRDPALPPLDLALESRPVAARWGLTTAVGADGVANALVFESVRSSPEPAVHPLPLTLEPK
jgi:3-oxoacyl-[acyl-carrier-protein] synthase II